MRPIAPLGSRPRRPGKLSIVVIIAVAVVAAGGTFAFIKLAPRSEASEAEPSTEVAADEPEALGPEETVDLGEFLVNITDKAGAMRYLKTQISLVVQARETEEKAARPAHGAAAKGDPRLPPAEHRIARDAVVSALCDQQFESLRQDNGWHNLRELLRAALEERLATYQITEVLITDLVMQ